jgi:short-subunit dehydrogenase
LHSPDEIERRLRRINRNLSTTSPTRAAEIIIDGIKRRRARIIVGPDARLLSWIQRIFPRRYFAIANKISGGKLSET